MRKIFLMGVLAILAIAMVGCATPGSFTSYNHPADEYEFQNEKYVDTSPELVWDNLVKELSKSYFMINNIDKESRIINVSFSTEKVCEYVDCGDVTIKVKKSMLNKLGKEQYDVRICEPSNFILDTGAPNPAGIMAPIIIDCKRKPSLEGRMNIYIAPQGNGTLVTVNCRYIITININEYQTFYAPAGNPVGSRNERDSYSCSLNTKNPQLCTPINGDGFLCHATGKLESEILSLVK